MTNLKIVTEIEHLYPDIKQELCNRHSQLYGKIKDIFANIYDYQQPQFFINLKGIFQIFQIPCIPISISMALENGIVISLSKLSQNLNIYVNSNYQEEEIILNSQGEIIQNNRESDIAQWLHLGFQIGSKFSNRSNFNGAIIYIHNNIQIDPLKFKQANILGGWLIFLLINDLIDKVSIRQIQQIIKQINNVGPILLNCNNNELVKKNNNIIKPIPLIDTTWKFIIFNMISEERQNQQIIKLKQISEIENKLLEKLICGKFDSQPKTLSEMIINLSIPELEEFYNRALQYLHEEQYTFDECKYYLKDELKCTNQYQKFNPRKKLLSIIENLKNIKIIEQDQSKQNIENTIRASYELLLKQNYLSKRDMSLVNLCLNNQAMACTIIDRKYLLVMIQKSRILRLFDILKKQIFNMLSKQQKCKGIENLLFSTSPSRGVGILKPNIQTQLWY